MGGGVQRPIHKENYITKAEIDFQKYLTIENIFLTYKKFLKGKRNRKDINEFQLNIFENLKNLYIELKNKTYKHSDYLEFKTVDTKVRIIHKAKVKDRVVHRLVYDMLYDFFDKRFIYDSYSSRKGKGIYKAIERYDTFARKITRNYTYQAWVLKFDIKKCFLSIDNGLLFKILERNISDRYLLSLCKEILQSHKPGLPLDNLTSQLFINVYLNQLDFYVKEKLKIRYYIRYADDIICIFEDKKYGEECMLKMRDFCQNILKIKTHKESIQSIYSGVDFLGFVHLKDYKILRKSTKKRILKNINEKNKVSYLGLLGHANEKRFCGKMLV